MGHAVEHGRIADPPAPVRQYLQAKIHAEARGCPSAMALAVKPLRAPAGPGGSSSRCRCSAYRWPA
ncbi:MAG: hypothetical protein RJA10_26 [Pseudomonadota bacterium]